jgi:hypothetical protein
MVQSKNTLFHGLKKTAIASFFIALGLSNSVFAEEWESEVRIKVKGGLVKDTVTSLIWMRCSLGQTWDGRTCSGTAKEYTWQEAMNAAKHFEYAGYSDWRLPTIDELKSLVYCSHGYDMASCSDNSKSPTIRDEFPNTSVDWFWSSSHHPDGGSGDAVVNFTNGFSSYSYDKSSDNLVRLVR